MLSGDRLVMWVVVGCCGAKAGQPQLRARPAVRTCIKVDGSCGPLPDAPGTRGDKWQAPNCVAALGELCLAQHFLSALILAALKRGCTFKASSDAQQSLPTAKSLGFH
uniref:Uncharacterized protein n=1 Tax=Chrysotila carterae TaxID=13221 RepID=A0A7S4FCN8_CHRCT